jgi:hypothetical protein
LSQLITQNDSFSKNSEEKNLGKLLGILQNVIEKSFLNWRLLSLVKITTRISETPCIAYTTNDNFLYCEYNYGQKLAYLHQQSHEFIAFQYFKTG